MAQAKRTFSVLEPAAKAWLAAANVNRWTLLLQDAAKKGWGDRWSAQSLAPGSPVLMLLGERVVQEWAIDETVPEQRLRLSSRVWRGRPQGSMASSLMVTMTQMSPAETMVDLSVETRFDAPNWGFFFNMLAPVEKDLRRLLAHMEKGIVDALSGG